MLTYKEQNPSVMTTASNFDMVSQGVIKLSKKERTWSFSGFRDMVSDRTQPIFTTDWSDNTYRAAYTMGHDKAVNNNVIGGNQWFDLQRFRDKYLGVRLIFSNFVGTDNSKLIFNYMYTQQTFSPR